MGCLPLIILFVLGALIGDVFWGNTGLLWGSGIGLVLGLISGVALIWVIRKAKEGK
jgi:NhaP-type Na+/H+ or K+/H+ antiporter